MVTYYIKRALQILREDGFTEFINRIIGFYKSKDIISRDKRASALTYKNKIKNELLYDAPARPYKTIKVNTKNISFLITNHSKLPISKVHHDGLAQIRDGNWPEDNDFMKFDDYPVKISFEQRFLNNQPWRTTLYYKYLVQEKERTKEEVINQFGVSKKERTEEEAMNRLNNLESIYQSILNNGYQPKHSGPNKKGKYGYRDEFEPLVIIDDMGEIYVWDGRHRFCIAQILDLEIPVHVVCRHPEWQQLRDEIHDHGLPEEHEELRNHPDLQDVIED